MIGKLALNQGIVRQFATQKGFQRLGGDAKTALTLAAGGADGTLVEVLIHSISRDAEDFGRLFDV